MSIYTTLWHLLFPRHGDAYAGCEWVAVWAQGVPAHIGTPTPGYGYESGDPFAAFLPPALSIGNEVSEDGLGAVVFVVSGSRKGTARSGQEYESPLLVLTGTRICRSLVSGTARPAVHGAARDQAATRPRGVPA